MRGRLIGHDVGHDAAAHAVRAAPRRCCPPGRPRVAARRASRRRAAGAPRRGRLHPVAVPGFDPAADALRVDVDAEEGCAVHGRGQRLRAAHAAEAGGDHQPARQRAAEVLAGAARRRSRRSPAGCPACRCRSTSRRSSARTSSGPPPRAGGIRPRSPSAAPGGRWRSAPAAPLRACGRRRPVCRSGPAASRRSPAAAASPRSGRSTPSCARPCRCRRTRSARRGAPPPRDRDCSSACAGRPPDASRGRRAVNPSGRGQHADRRVIVIAGSLANPRRRDDRTASSGHTAHRGDRPRRRRCSRHIPPARRHGRSDPAAR